MLVALLWIVVAAAPSPGPAQESSDGIRSDSDSTRREDADGNRRDDRGDRPWTALDAALAMEKALTESIAMAENSVVAIACVRQSDRALDIGGLNGGPLNGGPLNGGPMPIWNTGVDPESPDFIPDEYGTGVIVDQRGLIVTNAHVLGKMRLTKYYVWLARKPYEARVKAVDPWMDLAVLEIDADNLQPIRFGDVSALRKGQIVIALGNPHAIARDGEPSASWGIVANLSRQAAPRPTQGPYRRDSMHHFGTLIQTDAKLNLGTSGGALVNLRGEMIGLTTSLTALTGYERSAGFALPVDDTFRRALENLKMGRVPEYGFLGVEPENLTPTERKEGQIGVRVQGVIPGTAAFQAGLERGDIITHVDGTPVLDATRLIRQLSAYPVEATARLTYLRPPRDDTPRQCEVVLGKKYVHSSRPAYAEVKVPAWRGMQVDYATAIPPTQFMERASDIDLSGCVVVTEVAPDSPAWKAGLRRFSFVSHVGEKRVASPRQFHQTVRGLVGDVQLRLTTPRPNRHVAVVAP